MTTTLAAPSQVAHVLGLACAAAVPARAMPPQDSYAIWTLQAENDAVSTL